MAIMAEALDFSLPYDYQDPDQAEEEASRRLKVEQRLARQALDQAKKKAVEAATKQVVKGGAKLGLRFINGAAAATLVGIIVTFIIMNLQFFLGNTGLVPSLKLESTIEIVIIVALDLILAGLFVVVLLIIYVAAAPLSVKFGLILGSIKDLISIF